MTVGRPQNGSAATCCHSLIVCGLVSPATHAVMHLLGESKVGLRQVIFLPFQPRGTVYKMKKGYVTMRALSSPWDLAKCYVTQNSHTFNLCWTPTEEQTNIGTIQHCCKL